MLVATWNVNSILARMPLVLRWLDDVRPDVLCMQETKCTDDKFPTLVFQERGYKCQLFGQQSYNGVAILTRGECETGHRGYPGDDETAQSRLITSTVEGIQIVNVYIPNGQAVGSEKFEMKLGWMRRLRQFFDDNYDPSRPVLLCGDFNVAPEERDVHDVRLWQGRIMFSEPERTTLQNIKDWGFTDAFRLHNEEGGKFTWWDYRAGAFRRNLGLRIDHIWITEPLVSRSVRTWIDIEPRTWEKPSDHAPVITEL
ncbi:MAG TPA: exodeoxyribonuclease III [Pyrinomonadaceae bacterium]|jgi:exodeoxyribonuclease-3|nr:exodeoxyribonuclease III [Pyrinomonadaceae bacterium]